MIQSGSLAAAINESVTLHVYDPAWPAMFDAERVRLLSLFPTAFTDIQHIGSTAVPGLAAKPVIDILAGVASMEAADALLAPLCKNAYTTSAEFNAGLTDRRWLMRWLDGHRTHHLHLVVFGSHSWRQHLRFRDILRSDPAAVEQYARLKQSCASKHQNDREAYTAAKSDFIRTLMENATP